MGRSQRQRYFTTRQASLRSQQVEDIRQTVDYLEVENHQQQFQLQQQQQQLATLLSQVEELSAEVLHLQNRLLSRVCHHDRRILELRHQYNSLRHRFNALYLEVDLAYNSSSHPQVQGLRQRVSRLHQLFTHTMDMIHRGF